MYLGEGEPPLLAREGVPLPPDPLPLPQRAFIGKMKTTGTPSSSRGGRPPGIQLTKYFIFKMLLHNGQSVLPLKKAKRSGNI